MSEQPTSCVGCGCGCDCGCGLGCGCGCTGNTTTPDGPPPEAKTPVAGVPTPPATGTTAALHVGQVVSWTDLDDWGHPHTHVGLVTQTLDVEGTSSARIAPLPAQFTAAAAGLTALA